MTGLPPRARRWNRGAFTAAIAVAGLATCGRPPGGEAPPPPVEVANALGMRFRLIPAGSFDMGSITGQPDEQPVHPVRLSAFFMGVHEVTQEQYEAVMGENPARFRGATLPVESVSWQEAATFCDRLTTRDGAVYRLPTEAEWEYAARGGVERWEFVWGDQPLPVVAGVKYANVADETFRTEFPDAAAESGYLAGYDDGYATTAPVGTFAPNGYGLHDMVGNVFEWCADRYVLGTQYYRESPSENPTGPETGEDRVLRGASWWAAPPRYYRVASRFRDDPGRKVPGIGFRCVREVKPAESAGTEGLRRPAGGE